MYSISERAEKIVKEAQRKSEFAYVYDMKKTNKIKNSLNLSQAIRLFTPQKITTQMDQLESDIDEVISRAEKIRGNSYL